MSAKDDSGPSSEELAAMSRDELVRLGAKLDDVDIAYRQERWPIPGTRAEKRAERSVAMWFFLAGISALASVAVFIFWPWQFSDAATADHGLYIFYTPLVGTTAGIAILAVGVGVIAYSKKFIPEEVSVQQRHIGGSPEVDQRTTIAMLSDSLDTSGIGRRSLIKRSLGFGAGALGLLAIAPLGGFIKNPWAEGDASPLWTSGWTPTSNEAIYLRRDTGRPDDVVLVKPEDLDAGSMETVFPYRKSEEGNTEALSAALHRSDNPVMLIRLRSDAAAKVVKRSGQEDFNYGDFYAYSKICTHLGCPTSLYESQTNRILCPCHQSQFDALTYAKPIFGPAARALPQLPITTDADGYLVAKGDFIESLGPAFWGAEIMTTIPTQNRTEQVAAGAATWADDRYHLSAGMRRQINKVFPTHWSFLLGEIALYSFVILLVSGVYLTIFFDPSLAEVTYNGAYQNLRGIEMSRAYETALNISFEVRGGLFVRQIHHWAALLFLAAMVVHLFRVFFTGAFRKPREANWVLGALLLILGIVEGFMGYSLPDDLLSGTGLRIASAIMLSLPVIGTWTHWLVFGDEFPGTLIIDRLYIAHVLLVPAILLALIGAHLALVWYQKHTQFPGPGRTEQNVVGVRIMPLFAIKAGGFFAVTLGVLAIMAGVFQINPIWTMGPYNPSQISSGSQPDWYMGFTDGLARLWPAWEIYPFGHTVPAVVPVALILGLVFGVLIAYPFMEQWLTKDKVAHNILQRPRDVPVRTSLGAMAITFYVVLTISAANDVIAYHFDISLNAMTWIGRTLTLLLPPLMYMVTYRFCLALQRSDREVLEHGIETGIIKRLPHGEFVEVHQPLGGVDAHGHAIPLEYQGGVVPKKMNKLGSAGRPGRGSLLSPDPVEETDVLDAAEHRGEVLQRRALAGKPDAGKPIDPRD